MKTLLVAGLLAGAIAQAQGQVRVATMDLPTYLAGGIAYNPLAGGNLWGSAILPVSTSAQLYESTTADMFPVRVTVNGKSAYIFTSSVREGVHRVLSNDGKNMTLIGGDLGLAFGQGSPAGATRRVSGAVTATYIRQLNAQWALMLPVRLLYIPTLGGWDPIIEFGLVWKPGGK